MTATISPDRRAPLRRDPPRRGPSRRALVCGAPALLLAGCVQPSFHQRAQTLPRGQGGVLLMPPDIELSEVSAGGVLEPKADWTQAAELHLGAALDQENRSRNLAMRRFRKDAVPSDRQNELEQVQQLHGAVGRAVLRHHFQPGGQPLPTKQGKFDWTLGPAVRPLKQATGADYALFVWVRDSYASAGRRAVQVLGTIAAAMVGVAMVIPGGQQVGFASLVDLGDGEIIWFNRLARTTGDLRTGEAAAETARVLLTGFPT
jgi:hypothetical protein